jgi:flagellar basal-body rod protein FlgB
MIDGLISNPTVDLLEKSLSFTEQRHQVILQNIANVSTPGYVQQDVSVAGFQQAMRDAVDQRRASYNDTFEPASNETVEFSPPSGYGSEVRVKTKDTQNAMAFHDKGVRSIEDLQSDLADNALAHNAVAQMLKSRYDWVMKAVMMKP